jgi:hypothetical protein
MYLTQKHLRVTQRRTSEQLLHITWALEYGYEDDRPIFGVSQFYDNVERHFLSFFSTIWLLKFSHGTIWGQFKIGFRIVSQIQTLTSKLTLEHKSLWVCDFEVIWISGCVLMVNVDICWKREPRSIHWPRGFRYIFIFVSVTREHGSSHAWFIMHATLRECV